MPFIDTEARWITLGLSESGALLVAVHAYSKRHDGGAAVPANDLAARCIAQHRLRNLGERA